MRNFIWLLATLILHAGRCLGLCYYPNGSVSPQDLPCSSGINSTCCGPGFACLTNNICMLTSAAPDQDSQQYVRGSCSDKSFTFSSCPLFCSSSASDNVGGGQGLLKCDNIAGDAYICYEGSSSSCNNQDSLLRFQGWWENYKFAYWDLNIALGQPNIITTIGVTSTSTSTKSTPSPSGTGASSSIFSVIATSSAIPSASSSTSGM